MSVVKSSRACVETLESRQLLTVVPGFAESLVASGMTRPTQMAFAPDGRLFVTQQDGKLRVIKNGSLLSTPFLTVTTHNKGERGLIGITFDPNFATNKYLYIFYTRPNGSGGYHNRVSRFTANGDVAVAGSEKVLFETDTLKGGEWHNSGGLKFGADGKLYITSGDNQQGGSVQSLTTTLGKIFRINSDGTIPTDNPFYNQTTGKYRGIWALGFRNPFSLDVQPGTGRIFVNDVGAAAWEEINELKKGANYGWKTAEGPSTNPAFTNPFYAYPHAGGETDDSAITGAAFYNPPNATFPADYIGDFFFGDYGLGTIKRIDLTTKTVSNFISNVPEITDVETGPDGALYYTSRAAGQIFRAAPTVSSAPTIAVPPQSKTVAAGQPVTFTVSANGTGLSYQWQRNNQNIPGATASSYTIPSTSIAEDNGDTFRVIVSNAVGGVISNPATLTVINDQAPTATITSPDGSLFWTGGGTVSFVGTGFDPEDGELPASAFTWSVDLRHDTHAHPFISPYSGVKSDTFEIPTAGHDAEHNIWYRIHLTVTDSLGISHSTFVDVLPQKINLSLRTEPAGLSLTFDGAPVTTPYESLAITGIQGALVAPATQTLDGVTYAFDGWSDGVASATRNVVTPGTDVTFTARYKVSTTQTHTLVPTHDSYVRDGSYAAQNFGAANVLQVKNDAVGWNRYSYLTFDLAGVGADVTGAKLLLSAGLDNTLAAGVPVTFYAAASGWSESTITWNNKPAASGGAIKSFNVTGTAKKVYEIDLTTFLQQQKAAGATAVTLVMQAAKAKATVLIDSEEAASGKPQLVVQTGGDPGPGPGPNPVTLRAWADAYVRNGSYAGTNYGAAGTFEVKAHSALGYTRETYFKFDLSTVTTVTAAKLRLYGRMTENQSVQTAVYKSDNTTWPETGLTWDNRPLAGTTAAATTTVSGTTDKWHEWDLTALLLAEKAAGRTSVTLVLRNLSSTSATFVGSSDEAAGNRPELVIT